MNVLRYLMPPSADLRGMGCEWMDYTDAVLREILVPPSAQIQGKASMFLHQLAAVLNVITI